MLKFEYFSIENRDPPLPIDGANPVSHERSSLYELARNNLEPCLELTLATGGDICGWLFYMFLELKRLCILPFEAC